jgi:hypothetical protein
MNRLLELTYHIPPVCQGQAVTYAYAYDSDTDTIVERLSIRGLPTTYTRYTDPEFDLEHSENLEFWSRAPKLGRLIDTTVL